MDPTPTSSNGSGRERIHCLRALPEDTRPMSAVLPKASTYTPGLAGAAITNAIVGLLRARTGRGPPNARTALDGSLAIVTLGGSLTHAEDTLIHEGHSALVSQIRIALLEGMRDDAVAAVEAIAGRRVLAYLTAHQHEPDLSVIAFHFEPRAGV